MLRRWAGGGGGGGISSDRSPWGDFWWEPVSVQTAAGIRVGADTALRLAAVWTCVRVLAETFSCLPFKMFRLNEDGRTRELIRKHWLQKLIAKRPNRWQNGLQFRQTCMVHLCLRGNAYSEITLDSRGEIAELTPIHPDRVKVDPLLNGDYRFKIQQTDGGYRFVPRYQIWHLKILSSDGISGMGPIQHARESLGITLSAQEYGARFFANDATPGAWIEHPGAFKDEAAYQTFRERWQANQTGANRRKTAILEAGMKLHPIELTNVDSQFIETRKFGVTDICRIFRVPPHLAYDLDKATNNNIEQQGLDFANYSILPWCEMWEAAIESDLMLEQDEEAGIEGEFDLSRFMRGDSKARSAFYGSGITTGWLTRNEARIDDGRNPLPGLDEPLMPLNMVDPDAKADAEAAAADETGGGNPDAEKPEEPGGQPARPGARAYAHTAAARLKRVAAATARRIAHKEALALARTAPAEFYTAEHAEYVSDNLGIPFDRALAYCERQLGADHKARTFEAATQLRLTQLGITP